MRDGPRGRRFAVTGASAFLLALATASAAGAPPPPDPGFVRVAASQRYGRNAVHRLFLGGGYRRLWETPVVLPLLDLAREGGGGLEPTRRFGGKQTPVLGFVGRNGRSYTFRSTDKDPSVLLPPDLQDTIVRAVVQDQMGAQHPGAPLVADEITRAAGVLTQRERLVVMPDDPALGEFREEFAGMVGTFYEYPQPASAGSRGFGGATAIIDYEEFSERLARGPAEGADARAYLRARLVDLLLGDFDRHRKQWRWARVPGRSGWQPIPEDRDMAFVRYEGVLLRAAHPYLRILQRYGPRYYDIHGLSLHGWEQDRRLLPVLEWPAWEEVARDVQARLTDDVIARAVRHLPPEWVAIDGPRLEAALRGRRDRLVGAARRFYRHLASEVAVEATDATETVTITRAADRERMNVEIAATGRAAPYFRRTFTSDETDEVRVYLHGGDDRVVVRGRRGRITLRIIAGAGAGGVDAQPPDGVLFYDAAGGYTVDPGLHVDRHPYALPPASGWAFKDPVPVPPRDWGSDWYPLPRIAYEKDVGLFLGMAAVRRGYG